MTDWLANAAPPQTMLCADLRAEIVSRGEAPAGRKAQLVAQLSRLRPVHTVQNPSRECLRDP